MSKPKPIDIAIVAAVVAGIAVAVVFGVPGIVRYSDELTGRLISDTVPRLAVAVLLVILIARTDYRTALAPGVNGLARDLVWCIPCFAVAVVNFPFSALISGRATVDRPELLWLFLLKCLSIAVTEESFFRAILVPFARERFSKIKYGTFAAVIVTAALFGLVHLVNLFFGAGVGATMLQVGYTFLIGCMLAVVIIKTENVWLCVGIHFIFDIGGMIITDLGDGPFQDAVFWALTAVAGAACVAYLSVELWKIIKSENAVSVEISDAPNAEAEADFDAETNGE